MMRHPTSSQGIALLELVVGLSIISVALAALLLSYKAHLRAGLANTQSLKAAYLSEEAFEAVRFMRDSGWTKNIASLVNGTAYYLYWSGSSWTSTSTVQNVDGFSRSFKVSAVNRDSNDDIVTSGGTLDSNAKKVDVTVAWNPGNATTTKVLSTYITNLFNN